MSHRVLSATMFFPRGGSAHVARALAERLPDHGWDVTLLSGSLPGGHGDARAFYAGLDVRPVPFGPGDAPMHPSFEDRPGAPDRVMASLDDAAYEAQVAAWASALADADAAGADVLHLHHLTPVHEAARRVAPGVPVVTHLHGTELLMLERLEGDDVPAGWTHARDWRRRLRRWAASSERVVVPTRSQIGRAAALLGLPRAAFVVAPNGFDPAVFAPAPSPVDRAAFWREQLVSAPRGWAPGRPAGSVAYGEQDVARLAAGPVALAVGRFTAVKRLGLLIRAWADRAPADASLVLVGGHPGEWEGEHPLDAIAAAGAQGVHLAGWHGHDALAGFFRAADLLALASVREQFGLVLVEAAGCGLPAVAVDRLGPAEIVRDGETGWLVEPDDRPGLGDALARALADPAERARRGAAARARALERYSWEASTQTLARVLDEALEAGSAPGAAAPALTGG